MKEAIGWEVMLNDVHEPAKPKILYVPEEATTEELQMKQGNWAQFVDAYLKVVLEGMEVVAE